MAKLCFVFGADAHLRSEVDAEEAAISKRRTMSGKFFFLLFGESISDASAEISQDCQVFLTDASNFLMASAEVIDGVLTNCVITST